MKRFLFELCAETLDAAQAAERGGADRIELCSQLEIGGVTPDDALLKTVLAELTIPVHVLIRPRGGDFVYSAAEFAQIRREIAHAKEAGAAAAVAGVLQGDGRVDVARSRVLVEDARPMRFTFHRAFDVTRELHEALEAVIATGADCLLTSGGAPDVLTGADALARLVAQAGDRIDILAGGGMRLATLGELLRRTGVRWVHGSLTCRDSDATMEDDVRTVMWVLRQHEEAEREHRGDA
ncbi:MAG TPA: copper homeostasis protein CutC [Terracidiphilus sp.]|nr:copper homeostasis protein CutC [Terracidiphilus sp.]